MTNIEVVLGDDVNVKVSDGVKPYTDLQAVDAVESIGVQHSLFQLVRRGKPTTSELDSGDGQLYASDGTDAYGDGDLVYAYNNSGTVLTAQVIDRGNMT
jgi:hypothetical protein